MISGYLQRRLLWKIKDVEGMRGDDFLADGFSLARLAVAWLMDRKSDLVGMIYRTALKPESWPELLEGLSESLEFARRSRQLSGRDNDDGTGEGGRPDSNGAVSPDLLQLNEELLGHFVQALTVADHLNEAYIQRDALLSLINQLPSGVFLTDACGRICIQNRLADELIRTGHGFNRVDDRLTCERRRDSQLLIELIGELSIPRALPLSGRGLQVSTNDSVEPHLQVSVIPLQQSAFAGYGMKDVTVAVFVNSNRHQVMPKVNTLADIYSLTGAEGRVLEQLALGDSINEIAGKLSVSVHTVRNHVKRLLQKTGTHRQAELVGLVLSDPTNLVAGKELIPRDISSALDFPGIMAQPESMECERFSLPDGRMMAYKEYGASDGRPVFFCHSAKGSRFQVPPADRELCEAGIRLIVPDRPGFGLSDPSPNQSVRDWTEDLVQLADAMALDTFCVGGYSTGSSYALGMAHSHSERVSRVLLIGSGINPSSDDDLEGMLPIHKMVFYLGRNAPTLFRPFMKLMAKGILRDPQRYMKKLSKTLCERDRETLNLPHVTEWFLKSSLECSRQGSEATIADLEAFSRAPEVDYAEVEVPVVMWHGALDQNIPLHLGEKLCRLLPLSELRIVSDQGHLMYYSMLAETLREFFEKEARGCGSPCN